MKIQTTRIVTLILIIFATRLSAQSVVFSEINYNSDSTVNSGNWVELYNTTNASIDITGWKIQNSLAASYTLPSGTNLSSHAYLVVAQDLVKFNSIHPGISNLIGPSNLDLDNTTDHLQLLNAASAIQYEVTYFDTLPWPKGCDGWGRTLENGNYAGTPNDPSNWFDGCMFGSPGVAYTPCNPDIVFSEINYNSAVLLDAGDWIELHNTTSAPFNLNGWILKDSKDSNQFIIPNVSIPANGYRVLAADLAKFLTRHPNVTNLNGPFNFAFKGKGEALRLVEPNGKTHFSVLYNNTAPWPTTPDSGGYTLELLDEHGKMDDGNNWFAGCLEGSPGWPYAPDCNEGVNNVFGNEFSLTLLSNPASDFISFQLVGLDPKNDYMISILDLMGRQVALRPAYNGNHLFSTRDLEPGIYFIRISSGNLSQSIKVIVQK